MPQGENRAVGQAVERRLPESGAGCRSRRSAIQLRAAQRLWIQYRDANCLYYGLGEGTIARLDAGECMRSMTEARAKEFEGLGRQ